MYYTVYKITNLLNGKIYIGVHKTDNLDDDYMGSGKYLKRSQEKYGIENFKKEILRVFDNPEDMFNMESKLVNEDFISRDDTYNLKLGGSGGNSLPKGHHTHSLEHMSKMCELAKFENLSDESKLKKIHSAKKNLAKLHDEGRVKFDNFKGKRHKESTKRIISEKNSINQSGSGNSQYGTVWIYNLVLEECKKIKKEEFQSYEQQGWLKGRKMKFNSSLVQR